MHVGFMKCCGNRIVVLEIIGSHNENRKNIVDRSFADMYTKEAKVIKIYNMHDMSDTDKPMHY